MQRKEQGLTGGTCNSSALHLWSLEDNKLVSTLLMSDSLVRRDLAYFSLSGPPVLAPVML